jgi:hypothetical protein
VQGADAQVEEFFRKLMILSTDIISSIVRARIAQWWLPKRRPRSAAWMFEDRGNWLKREGKPSIIDIETPKEQQQFGFHSRELTINQ